MGNLLKGYYDIKKSLRWARSNNNPNYNGGGNARETVRYAHGYKWFGVANLNVEVSLDSFGIACKCINLEDFKYECYAPDPEFEDCCINFTTTEEYIEETLVRNDQLSDFLVKSGISMVDFKLIEITEKLYYLCDYYDIIEFLGLGEIDAIPKEDINLET